MTIEMVLWMVGLGSVVFAASRVIARERPPAVQTAVQEEAPPPRSPLGRPHYEPRRPANYALPPVTIETLPIHFKHAPEMVPPIDRGVLAALVASARGTGEAPRPARFARGSIPPGNQYAAAPDDVDTYTHHSDLDAAETLRPASDLDDDAMTRTHMSPVR